MSRLIDAPSAARDRTRWVRDWFPPLAHVNPPNLVTSTSLVLSCTALMALSSGRPSLALMCAILTLPCDLLDGLLARRLGLQSRFGASLDSLADAVAFCAVPMVLAHALGVNAWYQQGLLVAYGLAGVWRLAHFEEAGLVRWRGRQAFQGVPTAYAASLVFLLCCLAVRVPGEPVRLLLTAAMPLLAIAMVSRLPFPKGGWHYRVMWGLLPLGAAIAWFR